MSQFYTSGGPSFSCSISPSSEYSELISFRMDWLDLLAVQVTLESSPGPQFKSIDSSVLSFLYSPTLTCIHDYWISYRFDNMDTFVHIMSLLFNMLSRLEKEMETHCSTLAWNIPWTEEPW